MAAMDSGVLLLLTNQVALTVFKAIVKNRSALFRELRDLFAPGSDEQLKSAVQELENAELIKRREASIADFNSYYVTANGLNAESQLRKVSS